MIKTIAPLSLLLLFGIIITAPAFASIQGAATVFVMGPDGVTKNMELKATKTTEGVVKQIEDFSISADNVVSTPLNGEITVFGDTAVDFTGAKLTPAANPQNTIDVPITNGKISFEGMYSGVYTLDVIIGDKAYECIVVVGQALAEAKQVITKQITGINNRNDVKVFQKGKQKQDQELNVCSFHPNDDPSCKPVDGKCPSYAPVMNEDGNCHPGKCPKGYEKLDDDETGTCYSKQNTIHCPISNAIVLDRDDCAIYEPDEPVQQEQQQDNETSDVQSEDVVNDDEEIPVNENGEPLMSNCGGEPCTATEKEDSTIDEPEPEPQEKTNNER